MEAWLQQQRDAFGCEVIDTAAQPISATRAPRWSSLQLGPVLCMRTAASDIEMDTSPSSRRARHDETVFCISVMSQGQGRLTRQSGTCDMGTGAVGIFQADEPHTVRFEGAFEQMHARVPARLVGDSLRTRGCGWLLQADSSIGSYVRHQLDVAERMAGAFDRPELLGQQLLLLFRMVWGHLSRHDGEGETLGCLDRAKAFIELHLHEPALNAVAVARALGVSASYLHRCFRAHGVSPGEYIWQQRLGAIQRLLADPAQARRPISVIASEWGCDNAALFSRRFRAAVGMPASQWRDRALGAGETAPLTRLSA